MRKITNDIISEFESFLTEEVKSSSTVCKYTRDVWELSEWATVW